MNFMYEVLGSSFVIALSKVTITSKAVPEPINLSLEYRVSMKSVEYPNDHKMKVGMNVMRS